jgi:hypothetical protein
MDGDGQFDYRTLTKEQIEYAIQHIDGSSFPKNLANARAALDARISGASPEPAPAAGQLPPPLAGANSSTLKP